MADGTRLKELQEFQRKTELEQVHYWGGAYCIYRKRFIFKDYSTSPPSEENPTQYNAIHRMEFPLYNGEEAKIWIRRCNRYFQIISIPEEQKVPLASVYMQGRAELWYQGHVEKKGVPSWSELTIIVLERFEDLDHERVVSEFNILHQDTTVNAYL
ncbi:UNVERIFIED_CONTAM: hypothetical protein Sradi_4173200 [Sesamum radiatum]|uniref:Retrotransposon gag domain-containing protein n=1 Tax=Sesamum radiatum TaxID=300843 RepID=A0AAW2P2L0_SESRA